jgi:DNA-binding transcriptional regulator YiaG
MTLARLRRKVGLSQHELSRRTGIPFSRICYWESGRRDLSRAEMECIKRVLHQHVESCSKAMAVA